MYFFFGEMSIQILCLIFHHIVAAVDVIDLNEFFGYQFFIIIFSHSVRLTWICQLYPLLSCLNFLNWGLELLWYKIQVEILKMDIFPLPKSE